MLKDSQKEPQEIDKLDVLHRERTKWVTTTWIFGVLFAVAVIVIFGLGYYVLSPRSADQMGKAEETGAPSEEGPAPPAEEPPVLAPVVEGVSSDDDPFKGPEDAKVTVIEFSDFLCPFCAVSTGFREDLQQRLKERDETWEAAIPKIIENYVNEDKVKFVFRDAPFHGAQSQKAAEATQCANDQDKYWEMHDLLFERQMDFPTEDEGLVDFLKGLAVEIGLDGDQLAACLEEDKYAQEVQHDLEEAKEIGVTGTPTYFINGRKIVGAQGFSNFEIVIEEELNK